VFRIHFHKSPRIKSLMIVVQFERRISVGLGLISVPTDPLPYSPRGIMLESAIDPLEGKTAKQGPDFRVIVVERSALIAHLIVSIHSETINPAFRKSKPGVY